MRKNYLIAFLALALAGTGLAEARSSSRARNTPSPERGLAFASANCAGCHALKPGGISPDPEAPPWDAVVNKPGLTEATLRTFLRDSHNYPAAMNFTISRRQIADLAAYMLTLQSADYVPATQ